MYKPYGMLSQFTKEVPSHVTLADLDFTFAKDVYPVGRLDADSEGLLLLSNNKRLNAKLLHPKNKQVKTYWVQVEGRPKENDIKLLEKGLKIRIKGKNYFCAAIEASLLQSVPNLPPREPPIRYRKNVPDTWISIAVTEGKNRQIRRMCAAIGYPALRLVRVGMAGFLYNHGVLSDLQVGEVRAVSVANL